MSNIFTLPIVTIQPSYTAVIDEVHEGIIPSDQFWTSCYKDGEPSIHARIHAELDERDRNLVKYRTVQGEVKFERSDIDRITCEPLNIAPTQVVFPSQEYHDPDKANPQRPQRITALDVSPDGSQFATGFLDGSIHIYPITPFKTSAPPPPRTPSLITASQSRKTFGKPHLSTVTSLRFFPSSRVLLTSGADFSLTILAAGPLEASPNGAGNSISGANVGPTKVSPVRTLRGAHRRSVTSTAIVAAGRNVISSSLDATIRTWDVPSGSNISTMYAVGGSAVNDTSLNSGDHASLGFNETDKLPLDDGNESSEQHDAREVPETRDQVLFCALQSGTIEVFDLRAKRAVLRHEKEEEERVTPLTSIVRSKSEDGNHFLATGSSSGTVKLYDIRTFKRPLVAFRRNGASVEDVTFCGLAKQGEVALAVATADGLPYVANVVTGGTPNVSVGVELVGSDCDAIRRVRTLGRDVWTSGDDAVVRRYCF